MKERAAKPGAKGTQRAKLNRARLAHGDAPTASKIRFTATLFRPVSTEKAVAWTFLTLPKDSSAKLPSRGHDVGGRHVQRPGLSGTLEPDGQGGHWLKVDQELREAAGAEPGDVVSLEIAPVAVEPEPKVPADLRKALAAADPKVRAVWSDITPVARRDWIQWIVSAKRARLV